MSQGRHCKEKLETSLSWGLKVKVYEKLVVGEQIQKQEKLINIHSIFQLGQFSLMLSPENLHPSFSLLAVLK